MALHEIIELGVRAESSVSMFLELRENPDRVRDRKRDWNEKEIRSSVS